MTSACGSGGSDLPSVVPPPVEETPTARDPVIATCELLSVAARPPVQQLEIGQVEIGNCYLDFLVDFSIETKRADAALMDMFDPLPGFRLAGDAVGRSDSTRFPGALVASVFSVPQDDG